MWKNYLRRKVIRFEIKRIILESGLRLCNFSYLIFQRVTMKDLEAINKNLVKTLNELQSLCNRYQEIINDKSTSEDTKNRLIDGLDFRGVHIDDLCLTFTLPGYDDYDIVDHGSDIPVNLENLQEYIDMVVHRYAVMSIETQTQSFREGLNQVRSFFLINQFVDIDKLKCFRPEEFEIIICGDSLEEWNLDYLKEHVKPAHGYGPGNSTYLNFLKFLSLLKNEQKREFLMFTIGSPRLPLGGLKTLSPKLTIVKKIPPYPDQSPNDILPSVMT